MDETRIANLTGALALALADRIDGEAVAAGGQDAAALAHVGRRNGCTIRDLSVAIGLSHAATVRLVDRMAAGGKMARARSARDARSVCLSLTEAGRDAHAALLIGREGALEAALAVLSPRDRQALGGIAERMLGALVAGEAEAVRVCRYCDAGACGACPVRSVAEEDGG